MTLTPIPSNADKIHRSHVTTCNTSGSSIIFLWQRTQEIPPDIYIDAMQCQFFYEELRNPAGFHGENLSNLETGSENLVQLSAISTAVSGSSRYTKMFP